MNLHALRKISYGLYVIASRKGDKVNGQIANTVFQITSEPPSLAVSINKGNLTFEYISESKAFSISILSKETPLSFIGNFGFKSGRDVNKFDSVNFFFGKTGVPIVTDHAVAYIECEVIGSFSLETHTIFFGKVVECEILSDTEPMTYAFYHEIKGGRSPKTAPTFIKEEKKKEMAKRYVCKICGYIYDPEKGDPDSGIPPQTPFDSLPPTWVCPVCGAAKSEFEEEQS